MAPYMSSGFKWPACAATTSHTGERKASASPHQVAAISRDDFKLLTIYFGVYFLNRKIANNGLLFSMDGRAASIARMSLAIDRA